MLTGEKSGATPTAAVDLPSKSTSGGLSGKVALLVGIDNYRDPGLRSLTGCGNDVRKMKGLLIGKFGFAGEDVLTLIDGQAKRDDIIQAFRNHLIARSGPGTVALFHFSGHGSHRDDDGNDEGDGQDETIVAQDSRTPGVYDISDDELHDLLAELTDRTKNVTVVLDCCHSGTGTRGESDRWADRDDRPPPIRAQIGRPEPRGPAVAIAPPQDCALITACRPEERAREYTDPDGYRCGTLTYFLVRNLGSVEGGVTYRDVMDRVRADVTASRPHQHPQLEGGRSDHIVFGGDAMVARPYVLASTDDEGGVAVEAGGVHGLTVGSTFAVFPPGTHNLGDDSLAVATVELVSVGTSRSLARRVDGDWVERASRAVETRHRYPSGRIPVFFDVAGGAMAVAEVRRRVVGGAPNDPGVAGLESVGDRLKSMLTVRESAGEGGSRSVVILGGDQTPLSDPIPADAGNVTDRIVDDLARWARWYRLMEVENPKSGLSVDFSVSRETSISTPALHAPPDDRGLLSLRDGDVIRFKVVNRNTVAIFFGSRSRSVGACALGPGRLHQMV